MSCSPSLADTLPTDPPETVVDNLFGMLSDRMFWSLLYPAPLPPWMHEDDLAVRGNAFGCLQPVLRRTAWSLLAPLIRKWTGAQRITPASTTKVTDLLPDRTSQLLPTLSSAILRSAWIEMDSNVHSAMWEPLLLFLTSESYALVN